jgi:hypothetical protein
MQEDYEFLVNEGPKGRWRISEFSQVGPSDRSIH